MFNKLGRIYGKYKKDLKLYRYVLADRRTPRITKILFGAAIGYAISPIDILPDVIPFIGQIDDLMVIPVIIWIGMRFVPKEVVDDFRAKTTNQARPISAM